MFKKILLKNGLRVITVPQKDTKAVTVLILVGTGSKYEKKEISGISHFLEHLLFKGTKKRPSPIDVVLPLDKVGGIYNAFTSDEYTGYYAKVDAKHFDLALDVISDIYLNSKLDKKELNRERTVIIEEINMYRDNPMAYVQILWNRLLYGDQPAGWDIAGTKESVLGISRQQILSYMKKQYVASNTIVCLAGDIKRNHQLITKIKKYFSGIGTKPSVGKPLVLEKQKKPQCLLEKRKTDQTHFCLGVRGYNLSHSQKYAQGILAAILGGMMSSRLFVKIREELGLAYYVKTISSSDTDTGCLVTMIGADNQKAEKAISAVLKEYQKISQKKIPIKELKKAKDNLKGKMSLLLETSDAQASFYGMQELLENKILTPEEIYTKIDKVTVKDILKISQDIFQPQKLNLALIGPFKDESKVKQLLKL